MINSFPWDSLVVEMGEDGFPVYDRAYAASDLQEFLEPFFSFGVFINTANAMAVTSNNNMTLTVDYGKCHIRGVIGYINKEREIVSIEAASSQPRIDTVVLRWDKRLSARSIEVRVLQGTPAAQPQRPQLTRTSTVYELGLADILVNTGSTSILQQNITDTRLETARCGVVTPFITIDVTSFYNKLDAALEEALRKHQAAADKAMKDLTDATDRAIIFADRLISDVDGQPCGCHTELEQVKQLLYELLGQQDEQYYYVGKTLYVPRTWGNLSDDTLTLTKNAQFNEKEIELS